jgi:diguanylate cyclase (GGDEF)-like protein
VVRTGEPDGMSELNLDGTAPGAGKPRQMGEPGRDGYATLLHSFVGALGADAGWLVVTGGPGGAVSPLSAWDPEGLGEPQGWLDGRFVNRLLESKRAVAELDGRVLERLLDSEPAGAQSNGHRDDPESRRIRIAYAVGAPVSVPETAGAAICAGFAAPPSGDSKHLLWATDLFAAVAALHLQDVGGFAKVIRGSLHDGLTGCLTYSGLIDALDSEIARSARRGHALSCCFLDLDDFGTVNRLKGHLVGNRVLAAVGEELRCGIRPYDMVGRFGGDEFVVLLPETSARDAAGLAGRLRRGVRMAAGVAAQMPVGASIGVAEWTDGMSTADLLESADQVLRGAKGTPARGSGDTPPGGSEPAVDGHPGDPELESELRRIFGERSPTDWWRL